MQSSFSHAYYDVAAAEEVFGSTQLHFAGMSVDNHCCGAESDPRENRDDSTVAFLGEQDMPVLAQSQVSRIQTKTVDLGPRWNVETSDLSVEELCSQCAVLRCFRDGAWKVKGRGDAKFLTHRETDFAIFSMRQVATMNFIAGIVEETDGYHELKPAGQLRR